MERLPVNAASPYGTPALFIFAGGYLPVSIEITELAASTGQKEQPIEKNYHDEVINIGG
jgi:hypothetical protein